LARYHVVVRSEESGFDTEHAGALDLGAKLAADLFWISVFGGVCGAHREAASPTQQ
jgi:hypothetical protein